MIQERIQPPYFPVGKVNIPSATKGVLGNGIQVFTLEAGSEDIVRIEFTFRAGNIMEDFPLLASSVNMMLTEGSEKYTSEELNTLLDFYGIFFHIYCEKDRAGIILFSLSKHTAKVLELAYEILFNPIFADNEFNALMNKRLNWYRVSREKMQNLTFDKFFETIFGSGHPYGKYVVEDHFLQLDRNKLAEFHKTFYHAGNMAVIISGRLHPATMEILEEQFGDLLTGGPGIKTAPLPAVSKAGIRIHIEKPNAVQTSVRIGSVSINKRDPDYTGLKFLDVMLGGYFGSRLMSNIREEKGLTYGINSVITSLDLSGYKFISTEVAPQNVETVINEIRNEIRILQEVPASEEEMTLIRNYMSGDMLRMFDGPFALAESFRAAWEFGLDSNYYHRLYDHIMRITPDEIMWLAGKYYKTEELCVITAGAK